MNNLIPLAVAFLAFAAGINAATFHIEVPMRVVTHPIRSARDNPATTRRVLGALAAAADIGDMISTHEAVCRPPLTLGACFPNQYAHETNPLFAPSGVLLARRFDAVKLGTALGFVVLEEAPHLLHFTNASEWDRVESELNIAGIAVFGALTANNTVVYFTTHAKKGP